MFFLSTFWRSLVLIANSCLWSLSYFSYLMRSSLISFWRLISCWLLAGLFVFGCSGDDRVARDPPSGRMFEIMFEDPWVEILRSSCSRYCRESRRARWRRSLYVSRSCFKWSISWDIELRASSLSFNCLWWTWSLWALCWFICWIWSFCYLCSLLSFLSSSLKALFSSRISSYF